MYVNHLYHKYYPNVKEKKIKWHQGPEKDMYVHYFAIVDIHKCVCISMELLPQVLFSVDFI